MKRILLLPFCLPIPLSACAQATLPPIFATDTANVRQDPSARVYIVPRRVVWISNRFVPKSRKNIHGDFGTYCHPGNGHSLPHGWAPDPTAWMSRYVTGVKSRKPGGEELKITPRLGNLQGAEGTSPHAEKCGLYRACQNGRRGNPLSRQNSGRNKGLRG